MANNIDDISKLRKVAKEHGLEIRFRNTPNEQSDFCIYIYDKNFRQSYAVGFDGMNNGGILNFRNCLKSAYRWIEKRDKRFSFCDGRWQYGRYHFIVWKDRKARDMDHYMTIENADKAAAEYVKQGCCVVCYDQPPTGKITLARIYGDYDRHVNDYVRKHIIKWAFKK